jgi:uncharacterized protein GlcG (DUF336 family)
MRLTPAKSVLSVGLLGAILVAVGGWKAMSTRGAPGLTQAEIDQILGQAEAAANAETSALRVSGGAAQKTRMHIRIVDRDGEVIGARSQSDAWFGSIDIAKAKAFTAMAFSSDQNALTTRSIGELSQPGGALWMIGNSNRDHGIIQFPGGLPLYKNGHLVGGLGVSGDGVDQDEHVAKGGAAAFEPPVSIRIDTVTGGAVHYTLP